MPWRQRLLCWLTDHVWWEHWHFEKIDRCIRCGKERPHQSAGCTCTICRWAGGLEGFKAHHAAHHAAQSGEGR